MLTKCDEPFAEHVAEDVNVDRKENEQIKTLPTVLHCHSKQPGPRKHIFKEPSIFSLLAFSATRRVLG